MQVCHSKTSIYLTASKKNVVRMLNAAICSAGTGNIITEVDDIETINLKIKEEDSQFGLRIRLSDLLEEKFIQTSELLKKKQSFKYECSERMINIQQVSENKEQYSIEFNLYEDEDEYYIDWLEWEDIARIYNCIIITDQDIFENGRFIDFGGTAIYEPDGESIKKVNINPTLDIAPWCWEFNKLIEINPERYRTMKIHCCEEKIKQLQYEIKLENIQLERMQTNAKKGISINPFFWEEFTFAEEEGVNEIERKYLKYLPLIIQPSGYAQEDLETVLKLRMEKWTGVNDELSACYKKLISELPDAIKKKAKELELQRQEEKQKNDGWDLPF